MVSVLALLVLGRQRGAQIREQGLGLSNVARLQKNLHGGQLLVEPLAGAQDAYSHQGSDRDSQKGTNAGEHRNLASRLWVEAGVGVAAGAGAGAASRMSFRLYSSNFFEASLRA
jgi:hypothetical protein